jgi:predicted ferric reductase
MTTYINNRFFRQTLLVFAVIPLLIWAMCNLPERSLLKESLSLLTILAFFQMIGQFFWARTNRILVDTLKMNRVITYHKIIGYTFAVILLLHPFLLVLPKFFETGVIPVDTFITIITTTNQGVLLGIIAWCLMLILAITALTRKKLQLNYTTWRLFHGILAILIICVATYHVIDLGRHSSLGMATFITILASSGTLLLLRTYFVKRTKRIQVNRNDKRK